MKTTEKQSHQKHWKPMKSNHESTNIALIPFSPPFFFISSFLVIALCFFSACASKVEPESNASNSTRVYNLKEVDQQPRAMGARAEPVYPVAMMRQGITGKVLLVFIVDTNGDVHDVRSVTSTNAEFEQAAIDAASAWKFHPGKKGGKVVNVRVQVSISFDLDPPRAP